MDGHEREKRGQVEPDGVATEDLNRRWYERITCRMPTGWYIVALCYATAVILVGWCPWNIFLILPVLLSRNHNSLSFSVSVAPGELVRSKLFCGRGGSV